jgi:hypothetical protein
MIFPNLDQPSQKIYQVLLLELCFAYCFIYKYSNDYFINKNHTLAFGKIDKIYVNDTNMIYKQNKETTKEEIKTSEVEIVLPDGSKEEVSIEKVDIQKPEPVAIVPRSDAETDRPNDILDRESVMKPGLDYVEKRDEEDGKMARFYDPKVLKYVKKAIVETQFKGFKRLTQVYATYKERVNTFNPPLKVIYNDSQVDAGRFTDFVFNWSVLKI